MTNGMTRRRCASRVRASNDCRLNQRCGFEIPGSGASLFGTEGFPSLEQWSDSRHLKRWVAGLRLLFACLFFSVFLTNVSAQQPASSDTQPQAVSGSVPVNVPSSKVRKESPSEIDQTLRIGLGDELDITVFGLPELSQHVRIEGSGDVSLPLVGNLHLAGLSSYEAQTLIEKLLADGHFVNSPHVSVYVKEYTTEEISVIGEVSRPGVYTALSAHRLLDLIQTAGGLTDKAGSTVTVSHRDDPSSPLTLTLSNDAVKMAENNIELLPGDNIVVSKAGIVYVLGEVNRPGGFVIEGNKITASQVVAMAAGPTHLASLNHTQILRRTPEGLKNIPMPLQKILQAKVQDVSLQADDIIFVPESKAKGALGPLNIGSVLLSTAIYRVPY
jgi:polysaccharide export outer membrane protein